MGGCMHYEGTQLTNSSKSDQIRMWSGSYMYEGKSGNMVLNMVQIQ